MLKPTINFAEAGNLVRNCDKIPGLLRAWTEPYFLLRASGNWSKSETDLSRTVMKSNCFRGEIVPLYEHFSRSGTIRFLSVHKHQKQ